MKAQELERLKADPKWWNYSGAPNVEYPYLWPRDMAKPLSARLILNPRIELPVGVAEKDAPQFNGWHLALAFRLYQHLIFSLNWLMPNVEHVRIGFSVSSGYPARFTMSCRLKVVEPGTKREWKVEGYCHLATKEMAGWEDESLPDKSGFLDQCVRDCSFSICERAISTLQSGMRTLNANIEEMQAFHDLVESRDPLFPFRVQTEKKPAA